jgi:hypothetical protein
VHERGNLNDHRSEEPVLPKKHTLASALKAHILQTPLEQRMRWDLASLREALKGKPSHHQQVN